MGGNAPDARAACWLAAGSKAEAAPPILTSAPAVAQDLARKLERIGLAEMVNTRSHDTAQVGRAGPAAVRLLFLGGGDSSEQINASFLARSVRVARHGLLILHGNQADDAITALCQRIGRDMSYWKSVLVLHRLAVFEKIATGGAA
jgi:hypothetical protein